MKKIITWLIVGVLVGLVGGYFYSSCKDGPLKRENAALKEEITEMKVVQTELEAHSLGEIQKLLEQIGGLQGNIDSLMTANVGLENDLSASQAHAAALEAQTGPLLAEVQPVLDANPRVKELVMNLMAQVATGKDQVFTLSKQVETWKGAFANSELKGLDYKKGMDAYRVLWEGEKALRQKIEIRLNLQSKRVGILEGRIKLTSMAGVVAITGGLAAILLIR